MRSKLGHACAGRTRFACCTAPGLAPSSSRPWSTPQNCETFCIARSVLYRTLPYYPILQKVSPCINTLNLRNETTAGAPYIGKGTEVVFRVGARQIKAKTTSNCQQAQGELGAVEVEKMNAVHGDKMQSEKIVRGSASFGGLTAKQPAPSKQGSRRDWLTSRGETRRMGQDETMRGGTWRDEAGRGATRRDESRRDGARRGETGRDEARRHEARGDETRRGEARRG